MTAPATTKTHWREVHQRMNKNLLFAEDLNGRTSVVMEVIDSGVIGVSDGDKKKPMPWIAFKGRSGKPLPKVLALNATNCKAMTTLTGTGVIEEWRGPIELVVVRTKFKDRKTGEQQETDAIRIAPRRPGAAKKDSAPLDEAQQAEIEKQIQQDGVGAGPSDDWYETGAKPTDEKPKGDGYAFDPDADKDPDAGR